LISGLFWQFEVDFGSLNLTLTPQLAEE